LQNLSSQPHKTHIQTLLTLLKLKLLCGANPLKTKTATISTTGSHPDVHRGRACLAVIEQSKTNESEVPNFGITHRQVATSGVLRCAQNLICKTFNLPHKPHIQTLLTSLKFKSSGFWITFLVLKIATFCERHTYLLHSSR
jgi:hypothetical protein